MSTSIEAECASPEQTNELRIATWRPQKTVDCGDEESAQFDRFQPALEQCGLHRLCQDSRSVGSRVMVPYYGRPSRVGTQLDTSARGKHESPVQQRAAAKESRTLSGRDLVSSDFCVGQRGRERPRCRGDARWAGGPSVSVIARPALPATHYLNIGLQNKYIRALQIASCLRSLSARRLLALCSPSLLR